MKNKGLNFNLISKYRNEMFGLSIISIMVFHFFLNIVENCKGGLNYTVARAYDNIIGSVGVELFLFLSGMGLYYSMKKNSNLKQFYVKRMTRVLIPYAIWGGVYWIGADIIAGSHDIVRFFVDFSFISFWTEGERALWYIAFIVIMYLAFPLIFKLFDSEKYGFVSFCALLAVSLALGVALKTLAPEIYNNIEIAVTRVPIFLIGSYLGKKIYRGDSLRLADCLVAVLGVAVHIYGILQRYGVIETKISFFRYEIALFSISLIYFCVWVLSKVRLEKLKAFLRGAGAISLELYMTHVTIDNLLDYCGLKTYKIGVYVIIVILSVLFSLLLHFAVKKITIRTAK